MAKFSWQRYFELWEKKSSQKKKILSRFIQRIYSMFLSRIYITLNGKKIFEKYVFDLATIGMMTDDTSFICLHRQRILLLLYNLGEYTKQLSKMLWNRVGIFFNLSYYWLCEYICKNYLHLFFYDNGIVHTEY